MQLDSFSRGGVAWLVAVVGGCSFFNPRLSEWIALGLIVCAGIPHGAFDLIAARRAWRGRSLRTLGALYVFVGLAMSGLCLLFPALGLGIFLAISVLHFAEGESRSVGTVSGYVVGVAAIFIPILLHLGEAAGYLGFFVAAETVYELSGLSRTLGMILAALTVVVVLRALWAQKRVEAGELFLCLIAWCSFSPLSGFCVWFIGRHSRHHLARCRELFAHGPRLFTPDALLISGVAILLLVPLGLVFDLTKLDQLFAASIVLIAGLTLPHMIVTHRLDVSIQEDI